MITNEKTSEIGDNRTTVAGKFEDACEGVYICKICKPDIKPYPAFTWRSRDGEADNGPDRAVYPEPAGGGKQAGQRNGGKVGERSAPCA